MAEPTCGPKSCDVSLNSINNQTKKSSVIKIKEPLIIEVNIGELQDKYGKGKADIEIKEPLYITASKPKTSWGKFVDVAEKVGKIALNVLLGIKL